MVCLERWMGCLFLLVMFSAVHHFLQLPKRAKSALQDLRNKSNPLSQKQICDYISPLQRSDPNHRTIGKAPLCAENVSPSPALNLRNCSDPEIKVPNELPEVDANGNKIKSTNSVQDIPHLNNTANNSDLAIEKAEVTLTNVNVTGSTNNSNETIDNAESTNVNKTEIKTEVKSNSSDTTDTKSDSDTAKKTDLQDKKLEVNKTKTDTSTVTPSLNASTINQTDNGNSSKIDTEVPDMNSKVNYLPPNQISDLPPNITYKETQVINKEVELIDDGQNTEDELRKSTLKEKLSNHGVPLVQGQLAAILAGVFVVISVTAYVGLLSWRRYLENRYGNREMLVNEDEFNDDLRHFSI